jgi:hypothetical protein
MQKNKTKKGKASALAVTVIILGLVLSIGLSVSLVSILNKKASISSNKSNLAYSRADSGIEDFLYKIRNAGAGDTIQDIDSNCSSGVISSSDGYKVEFKDEDDNFITSCATEVVDIDTIKSTGIAENNQRSIEMVVAASGACEINATGNFDGNDLNGYDGGDQECEDKFGLGNRMCAASDFANGRPNEGGWYNAFIMTNDGIYFTDTNDCNGWTSTSAGAAHLWHESPSYPSFGWCNEKHPILCCKCE